MKKNTKPVVLVYGEHIVIGPNKDSAFNKLRTKVGHPIRDGENVTLYCTSSQRTAKVVMAPRLI